VLSSEDKIHANSKEAVLLKCGTCFLDYLKDTEDDNLEVIAFHLFPDILKDFYVKELPALIEKNTRKPETQVVVPDDTIAKFIESLDFYFVCH